MENNIACIYNSKRKNKSKRKQSCHKNRLNDGRNMVKDCRVNPVSKRCVLTKKHLKSRRRSQLSLRSRGSKSSRSSPRKSPQSERSVLKSPLSSRSNSVSSQLSLKSPQLSLKSPQLSLKSPQLSLKSPLPILSKSSKTPINCPPPKVVKCPRVVSRNSSNNQSSCVRLTTKKYMERPSPPFSAADCKGLSLLGNNGKMFISVSNKNGIYTWQEKK